MGVVKAVVGGELACARFGRKEEKRAEPDFSILLTSAESQPSGVSSFCTGDALGLGAARGGAMEASADDGPVRQLAFGASTLLVGEPAATCGMRRADALTAEAGAAEGAVGAAAAAGASFFAGLLEGTWAQSTSSGTSQSCWPERMRSSSASSSAEGMPRMPPLLAERRDCNVERVLLVTVRSTATDHDARGGRRGGARSRPQAGHNATKIGSNLIAALQWIKSVAWNSPL